MTENIDKALSPAEEQVLLVQTDNGPRPEDGPQDDVSQDPDVVVESDR